MTEIRLLDCLRPASGCKIALIFLHTELSGDEVYVHRKTFDTLWRNAVFTCAVDSGCNFLHEHFCQGSAERLAMKSFPWIPNLISGDFDSVRQEVLDFYRAFPGVRVVHTPDQDETDFTKALRLVAEEIKVNDLKVSARGR